MRPLTLFILAIIFGSPYLIAGSADVLIDDDKSQRDTSSEIIDQAETKIPDRIRISCKTRKHRRLIRVTSDDDHFFSNSILDPNAPTVFIIHGWMINLNTTWMENLADIFLTHTTMNTCIVDWSSFTTRDIFSAGEHSQHIGTFLADFLTCLSEKKVIAYQQMVLVGHGVGASVVSHCTKLIKGKIGAIYALDPIAPDFTPESALYTQCIYTGVGNLRQGQCQANYYVNGGRYQPMCDGIQNTFCSHQVSVLYFGFSLDHHNEFGCRFCRVNIFDVFCLFEERDRFGIYSNRKPGNFDCQTTLDPPYAKNYNDKDHNLKSFKLNSNEVDETDNLVTK